MAAALILTLSPLGVQGNNLEFQTPNGRVVIDNSYEGIHFAMEFGARHVPARATFESLGASVSWDRETLLSVEYDGLAYSPDFFIRDNRAYVSDTVVAQITDRHIVFNEEVNALQISSFDEQMNSDELVLLLPTFNGYTEEDLRWLSRIIHAEARGEPYEAMLAVGNVVLNRRESPMYPDTVRDVIFDRRNGVQFSPTVNGAINNTPSIACVLAAIEVLEGRQNAEGVLFFKNPRITGSSWMSRNRQFAFSLNNHDFFY